MKLGLGAALSAICLSSAVLVSSGPAAHAVPMTFAASLSGANEVPAVMSPGVGFTTVILDPTAHTLQVNILFAGLTSLTTAAHIHCCLIAGGGPNLQVATTVPTFPGFPIVATGNGVTQGNYSSPVFDLTMSQIYNPAFVTAVGGLPQAEAALVAAIEGGLSYLNVHTVNNPGGEIRGQLTALAAVPGPIVGAGLPGLIIGCTALLTLARRRRRLATA